jgi:hypothetical protein
MGSRSFNVETLVLKEKEGGKAYALPSSREELVEEVEGSRTPRVHTYTSEHMHFPTQNLPPPPTSCPTTISQEKTKAKRTLNSNDAYHDIITDGGEARDFYQICPICGVPERTFSRPLTVDRGPSIRNLDGPSSIAATPDDYIKSRNPGEATVVPVTPSNYGIAASTKLPDDSAIPEVASNSVPPLPMPSTSPDAPDDLAAPVSGILPDITDQLPALPEAPARELEKDGKEGNQRRRKAVVDKAHKSIRRARVILLRRRVLNVVLGRQLAGPIKDALNLISQENSRTDKVGAASRQSAQIPV